MSDAEGVLYLKSQSGISQSKKSFAISPEDFDVTAGHDITKFLRYVNMQSIMVATLPPSNL